MDKSNSDFASTLAEAVNAAAANVPPRRYDSCVGLQVGGRGLGEKKENDNPVEMVAAMAGFASVVIGILDVTRVNTGARLLDFGSRGLGRVRTRLAGLLAGSVRSARASPATKG